MDKRKQSRGQCLFTAVIVLASLLCFGIGFLSGTIYSERVSKDKPFSASTSAEKMVPPRKTSSHLAAGKQQGAADLTALPAATSGVTSVEARTPVQSAEGKLFNVTVCKNTCKKARDGVCNDGRGSKGSINKLSPGDGDTVKPVAQSNSPTSSPAVMVHCDLGTDCEDCGPWTTSSDEPHWIKKEGTLGPVAQLLEKGVEVRVKTSSLMSKYDNANVKSKAAFKFAYTDPKQDTALSYHMEASQLIEKSASKIFFKLFEHHCVKPDGTPSLFVDVGANFGWFSVLAAAMGCRVLAFEPVPHFRAFLEYNLHLNNLQHLVDVRANVVTHVAGQMTKMVVPTTGIWGTASIDGLNADKNDKGATETLSVPSVTLNDLVKEDVLLLKVDVEGWEWSVMKGADKVFRDFKVENVIMEYSPGVHERSSRAEDTFATIQMLLDLTTKGFRVAHIGDGDGEYGTEDNMPLPAYKEVTELNLRYDMHDAKRFGQGLMGCPISDKLLKAGWGENCNAVPEDLSPRSFRCVFGHNTNVWGVRQGSATSHLQTLQGHVGLMALDAPASTYYLVNELNLGMGKRDCKGHDMLPQYQVRHRCPCLNMTVCGAIAKVVEELSIKGHIASNYVLSRSGEFISSLQR
ncbi:hypothetical protein CEUSTIGMA_g13023.t1 [Chlamydomonas eustigma]|uniref:Methyltransferase FkbM domain-containing protein n=1 Tax=Chlamydomonas eustigma TaxID=1157962 RepID=A0A250XRB6_9CHLO|nr:hypothetical protein CEUSTIGMA_g13023.t1 [Chlamydomonas eustigma]|eukprot:GAX85608.1 hypothetical protein CEUSTIGMA_g13023.t1 [Chlamydomonas eustigma]